MLHRTYKMLGVSAAVVKAVTEFTGQSSLFELFPEEDISEFEGDECGELGTEGFL
jgi:hypothetical protein